MAERSRKVAENVAGAFYVDGTCIDCDLCRETGKPGELRPAGQSQKYSFVTRQPDGPAELAACRAAMDRNAPSRRSATTVDEGSPGQEPASWTPRPRLNRPPRVSPSRARYYIDAEYHRREMDRVFGRMWFCRRWRAEEIPDVGDYMLRTIGDESLIVVPLGWRSNQRIL